MTADTCSLGALAPLADIPRWIVARRADKVPLDRAGQPASAMSPANWRTYDEAAAEVVQRGEGFGLGFVLTRGGGVVVIDIDKCRMLDGTWSPLAQELCASLPGAVVEMSQSGRGLHVWCMHPAPPEHSCKRTDLRIEAYSADRFILLGHPGATGVLAEQCDALPAVLAHFFPPTVEAADTLPEEGPVPEWQGAPDADEGNAALIRDALATRSANAVFSGGASFADLWRADARALCRAFPPSNGDRADGLPYDASSADAALFAHLAFWTGKDAARMARLAQSSALRRDKWERADYVSRTIRKACKLSPDVLGQRAPQAPGGPLAPLQDVAGAGAVAGPVDAPGGPLQAVAGASLTPTVHDMPPFLSEDQLALEFAKAGHPRYRWSAGPGWMSRGPHAWGADDDLKRYDDARRLCRAAANLASQEPERRRLTSAKTVQAVVTLAQSDRRIVVPASAWDADRGVLNTPAGLIDLRSGQLCDPADHLVTQCTACAPDFGAAAPTFDRFLQVAFQGDIDLIAFVQRLAGYWLTGSTREQVIAFFHGSGANGKSVLTDLLMWLMGSYALKLPASVLMAQRHGEQHPTAIAQLRGKRLAVSSEVEEGSYFNESLLKELTGDETLTARFMRGDFFQFQQSQKHLIVGNYRPRLRGGDAALARRMVLVPFDAVIAPAQRDPDLLAKLKVEGPAVMAWAVRGATQWHADGLCIPDRVRAASSDYLGEHDDLASWVEERTEARGETRAGALYSDFRAWKEARGEHAPSLTVWGDRMQRLSGVTRRRSNGWLYGPIQIRPPAWEKA